MAYYVLILTVCFGCYKRQKFDSEIYFSKNILISLFKKIIFKLWCVMFLTISSPWWIFKLYECLLLYGT